MDLFTKLFDITKLPSKVFAWLTLLTGAYVFSPNELLKTLYLDTLPAEYKSYAGAAFVASGIFLAINVFLWARNKLFGLKINRARRRIVKQELAQLDRNEVVLLREFVIQGRHVIRLPIDHPTVAGLIKKHLIQTVGNIGYRDHAGTVFPVQLTEYAEALMTNELLELPENLTQQDIDRARNERPNYILRIENIDR